MFRQTVVGKRKAPYEPRFTPVLRIYLCELAQGWKQAPLAEKAQISQGSLSEAMSTEGKPTSLEIVDKVAAALGRSVTQSLTRMRDIAMDLDRDSPGWDRPRGARDLSADPPPVSPSTVVDVLAAESRLMQEEAEAHARRTKRGRKPRGPQQPPPSQPPTKQ